MPTVNWSTASGPAAEMAAAAMHQLPSHAQPPSPPCSRIVIEKKFFLTDSAPITWSSETGSTSCTCPVVPEEEVPVPVQAEAQVSGAREQPMVPQVTPAPNGSPNLDPTLVEALANITAADAAASSTVPEGTDSTVPAQMSP